MPTSRYVRMMLGPDSSRTGVLMLLVSASVIVAGIYHAASLRWLSDDIFITFRYIEQWFAGNGLVYNPGEYVEGYTHPLWLLLLIGWRLIGLDMVSGSLLFGIVSQGLLVTTLAYASWRMAGRAALAVPASAAAVALNHDASVWATSGLETGFFTLLVSASVVLLTVADIPERRKLVGAGSLLVAAVLTRPDGIVLLAAVGFIVGVRSWSEGMSRIEIVRRLKWFAGPSLVFVPYALWKLSYYGNLLPNTYYAKSGGGAHFEQGATYVWLFLRGHPSAWLMVLGLIALTYAIVRSERARDRLAVVWSDPRLHLTAVCVLLSMVYLVLFVMRVGGDFMYARFMIPIVPLLYLSAESAVRYLFEHWKRIVLAGLVLIPLSVGTVDVRSREALFTEGESGPGIPGSGNTGIVDEHYFWTRPFAEGGENLIEVLKGIGETLHSYWDGLTVRILIRGQACLAYYSRPTEVIENWGLTDPYIAHLEIQGRGRIGHEKSAPMSYIVARRVHFFFFKDFTPSDTSSYRIVQFDLPYGWEMAEMHFYDRDLMNALRERIPDRIRFVDFERYLDEYLATAADRSRGELDQDFVDFKAYYFNHNFDPERETRFLQEIGKKRIE